MRSRIARTLRPLIEPDSLWGVLLALLTGFTLFFLVLPTLIVIPMSFGTSAFIEFPPRGFTLQWYLKYLQDPDWMAATFFSLRIALATTVCATAIGTLASIALVRGNLPAKSMIQGLTL